MPKGRIKEILHTSSFKRSPGTRKCRGDQKNHTISKGDEFLSIKDGLSEKSYCLECARTILERGQSKLAVLLKKLASLEG